MLENCKTMLICSPSLNKVYCMYCIVLYCIVLYCIVLYKLANNNFCERFFTLSLQKALKSATIQVSDGFNVEILGFSLSTSLTLKKKKLTHCS